MIFRFRFKYKYICAVIVFLVIILLFVLIKISPVNRCYKNEPIDIVYTWVNGSDPLFQKQLQYYSKATNYRKADKSKARFFDRHELKFSLRSLEKYAPWVRNIYIITNGQIPYWLNLDYERVYLISHEEIYANPYNLPTFSSPSIESQLHRIPGISKRFLYFNDDMYLGAPVYLEDFYLPGQGYRVYLDYATPNCADDCPWMYVHDGQCDQECNVVACQMDGGDCEANITNLIDISQNRHESNNVTYLHQSLDLQIENANISSQNMSTLMVNETNFKDMIAKLPPSLETSSIERLVDTYNRKKVEKQRLKDKKLPRNTKKKPVIYFDAYRESLQHSNRIYNSKYGFKIRYVLAHMPFLIDADIITSMVDVFPQEFARTSANRFRSKNDMQFAFSYYNFLMEERIDVDVNEIFDIFDTDLSGTWSDREIRTVLTRLHDIPLSSTNIDNFDKLLINCSKYVQTKDVTTPEYERYIDSILPTISKELVVNCKELNTILLKKFGKRPKYKYECLKEIQDIVTFEMITSSVQSTVIKFDKIRKKPTKFVCLNDNIYTKRNESTINAIWYDFYVSLFPMPSQFELPSEYRNRFSYIKDLRWYQMKMTIYLYGCVSVFTYFIIYLMCKNKFIYFLKNKLFC